MKLVDQFTKKVFTISGREVLGRGHGVTLRSDDILLSRRHCQLEVKGLRAVSVTDLGSTNGTRINGAALPVGIAVEMVHGDVLSVGVGNYTLVCPPTKDEAKVSSVLVTNLGGKDVIDCVSLPQKAD